MERKEDDGGRAAKFCTPSTLGATAKVESRALKLGVCSYFHRRSPSPSPLPSYPYRPRLTECIFVV
jgi:hypothetical protein